MKDPGLAGGVKRKIRARSEGPALRFCAWAPRSGGAWAKVKTSSVVVGWGCSKIPSMRNTPSNSLRGSRVDRSRPRSERLSRFRVTVGHGNRFVKLGNVFP